MTEWFTQILNYLKLPTRLILPLVFASSIILFAPAWLIDYTGLTGIRQQYQPYLGVTFIGSLCLLLSRGIVWIAAWAREQYRLQVLYCRARKYLSTIDLKEAEILRHYIEGNTKTLTFSPSSGSVLNLLRAGILYQSAEVGIGPYPTFDFTIHPRVWDYLHNHLELIGITKTSSLKRGI